MHLPRLSPTLPGRGLLTFTLGLALCAGPAAAVVGRLAPRARAASTFVVNSAGDGADANTSDGLCDDGAGRCTLRAAIEQANSTPGADTVNFRIGTGLQTVAPALPLPAVTEPLTIDATTQPGFAGSPLVVLSGAGQAVGGNGLTIAAGPSAVRGLVINGFESAGIKVARGTGHVIAGNYIGTDASGSAAAGNGTGVLVSDFDFPGPVGALVGGTAASARNVISGNGTGVRLEGGSSVLQGNYVGVAADGSAPLPNAGDGVQISSLVVFEIVRTTSRDNVVGGAGAGAANVIAFNGGNGISVSAHALGGAFHRGNTLRGNSVHSNGLHGISLERPPGVPELNDASDADDGPNRLQNYPVVLSVAPAGAGTGVRGVLDAAPDTTFSVDLYANAACDASGQGEGQVLLGTASATTDASGHADFSASLPALPSGLSVVTATATDPEGNTSEFSPCNVGGAAATAQFKRAAYAAGEWGGTVTVTVTRTLDNAGGAASVDYSTSDGTARAGLDYLPASGTLAFAPGETSRSFTVQLIDDPTDEDAQSFAVALHNPSGNLALGGQSTASVTLLDDDRAPEVVPGLAPVVKEGDAGATAAPFTVRLTRASEKALTVRYATADGTATSPQDYAAADGQLTFAPGETVKTLTLAVNGDTAPEPQESFNVRLSWPTEDGRGANAFGSVLIFDDDNAPGVHLSAPAYEVAEGAGHLDVKVVRRGDTSAAAAVNYYSESHPHLPGAASPRGDYTQLLGRLDFAPGETEKTVTLLVNDDAFVEGPELLSLVIQGDVPGAAASERATVAITSDDAEPPTRANNPVDDTAFFVRQHYHDFLSREPDPEGFAFWRRQVDDCGADAACRQAARASVSVAFFLSIEFQRTGYQVFRAYAATYPEHLNADRRFELPPLGTLLLESEVLRRGVVVGQPGWEERLRLNTLEFARGWVRAPHFDSQFRDMGAAQYADALFANAGVVPTQGERDAAVAAFGAGGTEGRAAALLSVTNSRSVYNRQYNAAFVYMQYAGYLRRWPGDAPDTNLSGFDFWLDKLNAFSRPGEDVRDDSVAAARAARAEMARAFVESEEYRGRFGLP